MTSLRPFAVALGLAVSALPATAAEPEEVAALYAAMGLPQIVGIMREEGLDYGDDIARDMLGGAPGSDWSGRMEAIYDADLMERAILDGLERALADADLDPARAFFDSPLGQEIVALEVSAREAMLDTEVDAAAREAAAIAIADETARYDLVAGFATANDLIETNVVGALNANLAFYEGLAIGGALPPDLTQDDILRDVWAQEGDIRQSTTEWVYAFLLLAYEPLEDAEVAAYTDFSRTEEGRALNRALFTAFDDLFTEISRALGLEVAQEMASARL